MASSSFPFPTLGDGRRGSFGGQGLIVVDRKIQSRKVNRRVAPRDAKVNTVAGNINSPRESLCFESASLESKMHATTCAFYFDGDCRSALNV